MSADAFAPEDDLSDLPSSGESAFATGETTAVEVASEIGRLRRVLVHRPGAEIDWMVPSMMERLLFDDILYGDQARREHAAFRRVLEAAGVEVIDPQTLLADLMADDAEREPLFEALREQRHVDDAMVTHLRTLSPEELASALITGVRAADPAPAGSLRRMESFYRLTPLANYFFQRDPQVVVGEHVLVSAMATEARDREPLLSQIAFRHPALSGMADFLRFEMPAFQDPINRPTLEGGDVLVVSDEILLVGLSVRTNRWGVEALANALRASGTAFRHLIVVELPPQRSYMHLDTVFTFIDRGLCLAYLPVIERGGAETGHVYRIDLAASELHYTACPSLPDALDELGMPIELVPCGGSRAIIEQQREQWTDGANAFAIAPGVILLYRRNRLTVEALRQRGWRVLQVEQVLDGSEPVLGKGPTVISLRDNELSRARGGPRCMTMPLLRDPLDG
ncbi:MAG: arginine deiminase family protein [Acidobacteriota bacterium]